MHTKNHSSRQKGSALLVTIMITSVVLLFAMILLERIIPYSKQIRGLQDSVQSYYEARSQIELAKNNFWISRENTNTDNRITLGTNENIALLPPDLSSENPGEYLIISEHSYLPLRVHLYEEDTNIRGFGTNQKNSHFHTISSLSGILFDLSGRDTTDFSMEIETEWEDTSQKNIAIEFIYSNGTTVVPFFGNLSWNSLNGMDIVDAKDATGATLGSKLTGVRNCLSGSCSLKVSLTDTAETIIPVSFSVSTDIPDLNAVIVADGISPNTTYHSRIIELIPLIQGI